MADTPGAQGPPPIDAVSRRFSWFFLALGLGYSALVWATERVPGPSPEAYTSWTNDALMGAMAGATALFLLGLLLAERWPGLSVPPALRRFAPLATALVLVVSAGLYFYSSRAVAQKHYPKFWDSYHYLVGARYAPELGYHELYRCHLKADAERARPRFRPDDTVRDLNTSAHVTVAEELPKADCSRFTPERWAEFSRDVELFDRHMSKDVLEDRGYNGTPFHAAVAGRLASLPTLTYSSVVALTLVDVLGLSLLLAGLSWGFGWQVASLAALFLFTNFADRYYYIGASYFRYVWLVCLGLGLAALHRGRARTSAVLLVAASMLNVFPILYFLGIGLRIAWTWLRERRLAPLHRTFVLWSLLASVVLGAVSLSNERPVERYEAFFQEMETHAPVLSRSRVGLRFALLFEGEYTEQSPQVSYEQKQRDFARLRLPFAVLATGVLLAGAWVALRLPDTQASVLMGFLTFFTVFSTVEYYYASAVVLVLLFADQLHTRRARALLAALFGGMAAVYVAWDITRFPKFCVNYLLTWLFSAWLGAVILAYWPRRGSAGLRG